MPDLVQFFPTGEAETVRYHFLASLLLNEIQKQQQTIEEQEQCHTIDQQRRQLAELLKEKDARERNGRGIEHREIREGRRCSQRIYHGHYDGSRRDRRTRGVPVSVVAVDKSDTGRRHRLRGG